MSSSDKKIVSIYEERIQEFEIGLQEKKKGSTLFSYIRLGLVIIAIPVLYFLSKLGLPAILLGALIFIILFVRAVLRQQKYDKACKRLENLIAINRNEIKNLASFENIYYSGPHFSDPHHAYSEDLDLFGQSSLFSLINRGRTFDGVGQLAKLFLQKPTVDEVLDRQEAIQELEPKLDWRQDFAQALFDIEGGHARNLAQEIEDELEVDLGFASSKWLLGYMKILPFIWVMVLACYLFDVSFANSLVSFLFFLNLILTLRRVKETTSIQSHLSNASLLLRNYHEALSLILDQQWNSTLILQSLEKLKGDGAAKDKSVSALKKLQNIIEHLDYRLNFIPAILLNGFLLWDFRVLKRLASWKFQYKGTLKTLFDFVGRVEALSSMANFGFNHSEYQYPQCHDNYFNLQATAIQHPLIPAKRSVPNDFNIHQETQLSIITGSNMSGKSTLLRTIGINMVLGNCGAKVAAQSFSYPIVTLITYMRIKDVLEEDVSTFKAELNRIELILNTIATDKHCFILIDEMLRGTNSKDKLKGSIGIARKLLEEETYAMIATHDIKLAELGKELTTEIQNYYFDINYKDGDLVFDYKIKSGICENFNASFLLNQLGIPTT